MFLTHICNPFHMVPLSLIVNSAQLKCQSSTIDIKTNNIVIRINYYDIMVRKSFLFSFVSSTRAFWLTVNIILVNQLFTNPRSWLVSSNLSICFRILFTNLNFLFSSKHRYWAGGLCAVLFVSIFHINTVSFQARSLTAVALPFL